MKTMQHHKLHELRKQDETMDSYIDCRAAEIKAEIKAMAESARRSIGQYFRRAREKIGRAE